MTQAGAEPDHFAASPVRLRFLLSPFRALALIWAVWAAVNIAVFGPAVAAGDLGDTDNYMRLAQWRDFLAGQDWFDVRQHRFVGPENGDMHFSRLPDLALSIFHWPLSAAFGAATAERITLVAFPPAMMLVFLMLIVATAKEIAGLRAAYAAAPLALLASPVVQQFAPGRIDHHGIALCLAMAALWFCVRGLKRPGMAAPSAAAAILAVAISLETLPVAAAGFAVVGLSWALEKNAQPLRVFGAAAVVLAPAVLLATLGPAGMADRHCDMFAAPAAAFMTSAGLFAAGLSFMRPADAMVRIILAFAVAIAIAAGLSLAFPQCAGGPFQGMDPLVRNVWLNSVGEIRSPFALAASSPGMLFSLYGFPIAALAAGIMSVTRASAEERPARAAALIFLAFSMLLLVIAIRGGTLASAFAILPFAVVLSDASRDVRFFPPKNAARFMAFFLVASPSTYAALGGLADEGGKAPAEPNAEAGRVSCSDPVSIGALRALPPSLVFTPIDLGPAILAATPHQVTAAPYHRNDLSIRRTIVFFTRSGDEAKSAFAQSGAGYLVFCPNSSEARAYATIAPDGLASLLLAGDRPAWLRPVAIDGAGGLEIYRLDPG